MDLDSDFVGQVSRSQVRDLMSNSKICALLSDYEGLSIALVEAMMSGCRPLVSNIEANKSVVVNESIGTVIDHHNPIEVKRAISKLIGDSIENINISKRANEEAVQKYCEENQLIKMQELMMS